jgi:hypothetical protein
MINCRSISPAAWECARQALVFYFTRRHGLNGAEDLAHETLAAILSREDYRFEKEEDFLKVCYGFASHILQAARRDAAKYSGNAEGLIRAALESEAHGLKGAELSVYLDELLQIGMEQLREADWQLIDQAIVLDGDSAPVANPAAANKARVKLHRARRKLAQLVGLKKTWRM